MNRDNYIQLPFIEVSQPIGTFYITKLNWDELVSIAEADIRKIEDESKKNSIDSYLGIQREVSDKRAKEIGNYVHTVDATFPTSIILAIESKTYYRNGSVINPFLEETIDNNIEYEIVENIIFESNKLYLRKNKTIASILDGQHRIEGLKRGFLQGDFFIDNMKKFELNVTIFIDLDIDDQAQIFSVINKAQTKVNKSLVYDLYEYAKTRSPQKSAHDIVRLLNREESSPFFEKIKILGQARNKEKETIAQATFVELIINYTSKDPMEDRDIMKKKNKIKNTLDPKRYIFREFFINNEDERTLLLIWNFFQAVSIRWPISWSTNERGNILNKSTGLIGLFRFMKDLIVFSNSDHELTEEYFLQILKKINLDDLSFSPEVYLPGSSGQSKLYKELLHEYKK